MKKLLALLAFTSLINQKGFTQTALQNRQALPLIGWTHFHCLLLRNAKGITHVAYASHFSCTAIVACERIIAGENSYRLLRNYTSIQAAAKEAGMPGLYGEIHYRYSIEHGFALGEPAARFVRRSVIFIYLIILNRKFIYDAGDFYISTGSF